MTYLHAKDVLDRLVAVVGGILISPVLLGIALLIKLDSRGPVIFRQTRVGKNRQNFTIYKFRTMQVGSKQLKRADGTVITTGNDPRVTYTGRFLRSGLDELPQLWNIIIGEMSFVGPRPDLPEQLTGFSREQLEKYNVKPGITNLPAVCGRNDLDFQDRIAIDLFYIANQDFLLDMKIIMFTLMLPFGVRYKFKRA